MMRFLSKKILCLSYGIVACAMISCNAFGAGLSGDSQLDFPSPPNLLGVVIAHPPDTTKRTKRTARYYARLQALISRDTTSTSAVEHPFGEQQQLLPSIERPLSPIGYEAIFRLFFGGVVIYRPTKGISVGEIIFRIRDLPNPLGSTFDLSSCGNAAKFLSISTGYRREKTESENPLKWEVFLTPQDLIKAHETSTASHYAAISNASWTAPCAVIQNDVGWEVEHYWYNVTLPAEDLNTKSLYDICCDGRCTSAAPCFSAPLFMPLVNRNFYLRF